MVALEIEKVYKFNGKALSVLVQLKKKKKLDRVSNFTVATFNTELKVSGVDNKKEKQ